MDDGDELVTDDPSGPLEEELGLVDEVDKSTGIEVDVVKEESLRSELVEVLWPDRVESVCLKTVEVGVPSEVTELPCDSLDDDQCEDVRLVLPV